MRSIIFSALSRKNTLFVVFLFLLCSAVNAVGQELTASPSSIQLTAYIYPGQSDKSYTYNISVSGPGSSCTISADQPWMELSTNSLDLPGSFTLTITASNTFFPQDGTFSGTITIVDNLGNQTTVSVSITVVHAIPDKLTVTPEEMTLYFTRANLLSKTFTVEVANANYTNNDFKWSAETSVPWIKISPDTGVGKTTITVTVDPSALPAGRYCDAEDCDYSPGIIRFSSNLPTQNEDDAKTELTINLTIKAPNELAVFPSYLFWSVEVTEDELGAITVPDFTEEVFHVYAGPYGFSINYNVPWLNVIFLSNEGGTQAETEFLASDQSEGIFKITPVASILQGYGVGRYEGTIQVIDRGTGFYREVPVIVELRKKGDPISLPVASPKFVQMSPGFIMVEATDAQWLHMLLHIDDVVTYTSKEACVAAGGTWIDPFAGDVTSTPTGMPYCSASEKVYVLLSAPNKAPGTVYAYTPTVEEQFVQVYSNGQLNPELEHLDPFFSVGLIPEAEFGPMQLAGLYGQLFIDVRTGTSIESAREIQQVQVNIYTLEGSWLVSEEYEGTSYTYGFDRILNLTRNPDNLSYSGTWGPTTTVSATIGDGKTVLYRIAFSEGGIDYEYEVTSLSKSEMKGRWRFCYHDDCYEWETFTATRLSSNLGTSVNNPF